MNTYRLLRTRSLTAGAPASVNQGHFRVVKSDEGASDPEWIPVAKGNLEDLVAAIISHKPFPSGEDESTRAAWVRRRIQEIDPPKPSPKPRVTQGSPPPPFRGRARWENIQGHYEEEEIAVEPLVKAGKGVLTMIAVVLGGGLGCWALFLLLTAHAQDRFQNDIYANPDWQIWKGVGLIVLGVGMVVGAWWWEFIREPESANNENDDDEPQPPAPGPLRRFARRVAGNTGDLLRRTAQGGADRLRRIDDAIWSAATAPARYVRGVRSKYPDHGLFPALWEDLFGRPG